MIEKQPLIGICHGLDCTSSALIKAHIIPAGFGRLIRGPGPNISLSLEKAAQARPQLGEFDTEILCKSCDQKLGIFDDYAIEVCKNFQTKHRKLSNDIFEMDNFDGDKFSKFILAVLWRSSITKRKSFSQVSLGPYEDKARDVLFGRTDLKNLRAFEVLVQRYTSKHLDLEGVYTFPVRSPLIGLNAYGFSLTGLRIIAKLDNRPLKRDFGQFVVNGKTVLRGLFVEFEQTPEWEGFRNIAVNDLRRRNHSS